MTTQQQPNKPYQFPQHQRDAFKNNVRRIVDNRPTSEVVKMLQAGAK